MGVRVPQGGVRLRCLLDGLGRQRLGRRELGSWFSPLTLGKTGGRTMAADGEGLAHDPGRRGLWCFDVGPGTAMGRGGEDPDSG